MPKCSKTNEYFVELRKKKLMISHDFDQPLDFRYESSKTT